MATPQKNIIAELKQEQESNDVKLLNELHLAQNSKDRKIDLDTFFKEEAEIEKKIRFQINQRLEEINVVNSNLSEELRKKNRNLIRILMELAIESNKIHDLHYYYRSISIMQMRAMIDKLVKLDYIKKLIQEGADPNYGESDKLFINEHLTPHFYDGNALTNHPGTTPFMRAAEIGNEELIKLLINAKANVNQTDSMLRTALMFACHNINENIAKILLDSGADVHIISSRAAAFSTALHELFDSRYDCSSEMVKLILSKKPMLHLRNLHDRTVFGEVFGKMRGIYNKYLYGRYKSFEDYEKDNGILERKKNIFEIFNILINHGIDVKLEFSLIKYNVFTTWFDRYPGMFDEWILATYAEFYCNNSSKNINDISVLREIVEEERSAHVPANILNYLFPPSSFEQVTEDGPKVETNLKNRNFAQSILHSFETLGQYLNFTKNKSSETKQEKETNRFMELINNIPYKPMFDTLHLNARLPLHLLTLITEYNYTTFSPIYQGKMKQTHLARFVELGDSNVYVNANIKQDKSERDIKSSKPNRYVKKIIKA